jgi:integrase/recombinase XerD
LQIVQGRPTISISLDTRRELNAGTFPVKLLVTFRIRTALTKTRWLHKYYRLSEATPADFQAALMDRARSNEQKDLAKTIGKARRKAEDILERHEIMSPALFDRLYTGAGGSTVLGMFERYVAELREFDRVGTASTYATAQRSLLAFAGGDFTFQDVSADWLRRYERWMRSHKVTRMVKGKLEDVVVELSTTTIGMYLRCLRKIFNDTIADKLISADYYPFGRRHYVIQTATAPKHALSEEQKDLVLGYQGEERQAVDFWAFSYFCNGMSFADIARLRHRDIQEGFIFLDRVKTLRTNRVLKKIEIPLCEEVREIIRTYGNKSLNPAGFIFPVLEAGLSPQQERNRILDFIDRINQGLRRVAGELGFKFKFTTYTARHTYATISKQKGVSVAFIQEALGHASIRTTEGYLGSFDRETKRRMSEKL